LHIANGILSTGGLDRNLQSDERRSGPEWLAPYERRVAIQRWTFSAVTLARGSSLVVFASEKNRVAAGGRLHTDFKLPAAGGYLALTKPDGSVAHAFAPYPAQTDGFSYGMNGLSRAAAAAYFLPATPGSANGIGITAPLAAPEFSVKLRD
jgi:hypothetical protein